MLESSIVTAYKAVFSPLSFLYHLKPSAFECFHEEIDTKGSLSQVAGGKVVLSAVRCLAGTGVHGRFSAQDNVTKSFPLEELRA